MQDTIFDHMEDPLVNNPFSEADLKALEKQEEPKPEIVEPRKPNRHERRKRAKLEKMLATKERLEKLGRKE